MKDLNNVMIIGRLTKEPAISYTQSGVCIAKFSIANDNSVKDKEEVDFFDVTAFKATAEYIMKYIKKGFKIGISGRLCQQRWTDQNSVNHSKVIILANEVEILSSPQPQQGQNNAGVNQNPYAPGGVNPAPIPQQYQQDEGRYGVLSSPPPQNNQPAPQNKKPPAAAPVQNNGFSPDNPYSPQNWPSNPANPNAQNGLLFDPPPNNSTSPWDDGFYNNDEPPF